MYGVPRRTIVPISSKLVAPLQLYCNFFNFQDDRRCHLGFLKSRNFIGYWGPEAGDSSAAKFRQNQLIGCKNIKIFRFFKMVAADILDFRTCKFVFAVGVWSGLTHHCTKFRQNR